MNYSVITPARNEGEYIVSTIESVVNQLLPPVEWIILDDFSTDNMRSKIIPYLEKYKWILLENPPPRIKKDYSSRVVELFNYGMTLLNYEVDIIVKLDGDVSFSSDFFEKILNSFINNPNLGIASGHLKDNGILELMKFGDHNTRGATKCYRKICLEQIGGIIPAISWDTIDNAAARAKGWKTKTLPFPFEHYKKEGSRAGSLLKNHYRTGYSNGSIPYHLSYFLLKIARHSLEPPFFLAVLAQCFGYFRSRYIDKYRPFPSYACKQVRKEQKEFIKKLIL